MTLDHHPCPKVACILQRYDLTVSPCRPARRDRVQAQSRGQSNKTTILALVVKTISQILLFAGSSGVPRFVCSPPRQPLTCNSTQSWDTIHQIQSHIKNLSGMSQNVKLHCPRFLNWWWYICFGKKDHAVEMLRLGASEGLLCISRRRCRKRYRAAAFNMKSCK